MVVALQVCNLNNGGTQKYVVDLANSLVKRGVIVHVVCSENNSCDSYILDNKIKIVFFTNKSIYQKLLAQYIIDNKINILHSSDWLDWQTGWRVCNKLNIIFIKTVHATPSYSYFDLFRFYLNPKNYFAVYNIIKYKLIFISISRKAYVGLKFLYGRFTNSCVIYLGVDRGNKKVISDVNDNIKVIWAGSLTERKNPFFAIEIIKNLIERGVKVSLDIYGDGPLSHELINNINKNGLSTVKVINNCKIEASLYANYDFTLITSNNEGTPYVIFESMSSGIPVISTKCGAVEEIIDNNITGVVIESNDPTKFADKIISIYSDKTVYNSMSNESYCRYLDNYNLDIMADRTLQFYKSILK